jgi:glycosyltransferase involved in cell wall biosynthesis
VVAFVGQIKAYKNVSALVRAFFEAAHPSAILLIAGRAGDASIEADLRAVTQDHPRVFCHFGLIPDDRMHLYLNACNLTVFPYREILNSGSAILSLSFSRPTLVPSRGAMAELRQLAGEDWVYTFEGNLTGATLAAAIEKATSAERPAECELGALSWKSIASSTLAAYGRAVGVERLTVFAQTALAMAHPGMEKIQ